MRKVHLIAVTEPLVYDLALAIHQKGYEVSVSGKGLEIADITTLQASGFNCHGDGWFPELLTKDIQYVVLGAGVKTDNPELVRAKELGLLVVSIPEFVFQRTKEKTRIVVAGSRGKKTIISMMAYVLKKQKMPFDYALTSKIPLLNNRIHLNYESRIAIIEGDEHITSMLEKRLQLEFYRPHIAVLTNLMWSSNSEHVSPEAYQTIFRTFASSIERSGKLIHYAADPEVIQLVEQIREDITPIAFDGHETIEKEGQLYLHTRYGDYPIHIPNRFFLINMNAARLTCRQLGVKDADFYQAISEYSLSLQV